MCDKSIYFINTKFHICDDVFYVVWHKVFGVFYYMEFFFLFERWRYDYVYEILIFMVDFIKLFCRADSCLSFYWHFNTKTYITFLKGFPTVKRILQSHPNWQELIQTQPICSFQASIESQMLPTLSRKSLARFWNATLQSIAKRQ